MPLRLAAPSSCRSFVAVSSLIATLLLFAPLAACAGHYDRTYSGGSGATDSYGVSVPFVMKTLAQQAAEYL